MSTLRRRLTKDEEGFTLIELMVVVLIIAILIAIAIPTFLGAQDRARDRGAQSDLRNAVTAAKTIATDDAGLFTNVTVANLTTAEGALDFAAAGTKTDIGVVVDTTATPQTALFYKQSASNTWFGMGTNSSGEVVKCKADTAAELNTYTLCDTLSGTPASAW
ncbi:MAG TPA: prepilin-type N-terminal cleavage/methylation domain-containing protein [Acidimicrobiales bacterium]|nr:prepilin-type N-terminal cleavage/methylation domain-containing protein [Acidimicrobiales bacterium]